MKGKLLKLTSVFGMVITGLFTVLMLPVALGSTAVVNIVPQAKTAAWWMIQATYAQTLTLDEVTTSTGNMVTTYVPSLGVFIAAAVVIALAGFFVGRLLRAGRSG